MPGKMARSPDQTSFGPLERRKTLRSPPMASREPRRLLSSTPFQSSSGECRPNVESRDCARTPDLAWVVAQAGVFCADTAAADGEIADPGRKQWGSHGFSPS